MYWLGRARKPSGLHSVVCHTANLLELAKGEETSNRNQLFIAASKPGFLQRSRKYFSASKDIMILRYTVRLPPCHIYECAKKLPKLTYCQRQEDRAVEHDALAKIIE